MRNTNVTLLQEVGVSDSINALTHGYSEVVECWNDIRQDVTEVTIVASKHLRMVV